MAANTGCGLLRCAGHQVSQHHLAICITSVDKQLLPKRHTLPGLWCTCLNSLLGPRWRHHFPESPVASPTPPAAGNPPAALLAPGTHLRRRSTEPPRRASRSAASERAVSSEGMALFPHGLELYSVHNVIFGVTETLLAF